jgi:hypothetical protein
MSNKRQFTNEFGRGEIFPIPSKPTALIIMGTTCTKATTEPVANLLVTLGYSVGRMCWTKENSGINTINYAANWNIPKQFYNLIISHSAGGFPLQKSKADLRIAINPPETTYIQCLTQSRTGNLIILHASNDWLLPEHDTHKGRKRIIHYKGGHSDMPISLLNTILRGEYNF